MATNKDVVIGILTVPLSKHKRSTNFRSYLPNSYVKWLEMSGCRVMPIFYSWDETKIKEALNQVSGVCFTGGSVDRVAKDDYKHYIRAFKIIFNHAKQQNDNGNHYPLWATCLGFEFLLLMEKHSEKEIHDYYVNSFDIEKMDANHYNVPLEIPGCSIDDDAYMKKLTSTFFSHCSWLDIQDYSKSNILYMNHSYGYPTTPELKFWYESFLDVLLVSKDKQGLEYISAIQFKNYPFFGVQFHPEKPVFEWLDNTIIHTSDAIKLSQQLSMMFVEECRKNKNVFDAANDTMLIYYYDLYSRKEVLDIIEPKHKKNAKYKSIFERSYYFGK